MVVHDPDVCLCFECSFKSWELSTFKEDLLSKQSNRTIEVQKVRSAGEMPIFLGVIQRHYEKAKPAVEDPTKPTTLVAPLEMLDFLCPAALIEGIEAIEIVYQKR